MRQCTYNVLSGALLTVWDKVQEICKRRGKSNRLRVSIFLCRIIPSQYINLIENAGGPFALGWKPHCWNRYSVVLSRASIQAAVW